MSLSPENEAVVEREFPTWLKDFGAGYWTMKPSSLNRLLDAARSHESERVKGLVEAAQLACDLLAERTYGSAARSPGHNARLALEAALSAIPGEAVLAGEGKGSAGGRVPCPQMDTPTPSPAGKMDREELTDLVSDAISDSIDMDWTSAVGARYVVEALVKEGVITLAGGEG
jgi:hypothetical protein